MEQNDEELALAKFIEVSGLNRESSHEILALNGYNLEAAVNYHLENVIDEEFAGGSASCSASSSSRNCFTPLMPTENAALPSTSTARTTAIGGHHQLPSAEIIDLAQTSSTFVRPPIPAMREQILMPEEDNFRRLPRKRKRANNSLFTICPLRNFEREGEMQEKQLRGLLEKPTTTSTTSEATDYARHSSQSTAMEASTTGGNNRGMRIVRSPQPLMSSNEATAAAIVPGGPIKRSRLEDLYRPPTDLLFYGTLHAARQFAASHNRWLIVNLQDNMEFRSQVINRDLWTDPEMRKIIKQYFVLWQINGDNPEGIRFKSFYSAYSLPYICVLDPRTGEEVLKCTPIRPNNVLRLLSEFLATKRYVLDAAKLNIDEPSCSSTSQALTGQESTVLTELTEEEQIELAIKNSLSECQKVGAAKAHYDSDDDEDDGNDTGAYEPRNDINTKPQQGLLEQKQRNQIINTSKSYKDHLGDENDVTTKLQLRLPNGDRVQLDWPVSTNLLAIKLYLSEYYKDLVCQPHKLITAFPRQDILLLDDQLTLREAQLHPTAILHLHLDE